MIISKTPFRISFAGGGSDLPAFYRRRSGCVVSATIDKAMYIAIHPYFHDKIRIKYSRTEDVSSVAEIQHPLVRECLRTAGMERGMEIASFADVPAGSGMGSSSAFTVGLLNALHALTGQDAQPDELAVGACEVEIDRLGEPIGKQDQYAVAYGGVNCIYFHPDESVEVQRLNCPMGTLKALNERLMVFYMGQERASGDILAEQSRSMADQDKFSRVAQMASLAEELSDALENGELDTFGQILDQGWKLKSSLTSDISNDTIELTYRVAREAGAEGGKLLGAGGGGFLLLYCQPHKQSQVREALAEIREMPFALSSQGSTIMYNDRHNGPILAAENSVAATSRA